MKENLYNYNMEIYCENNQEKKKLLNRYSRFQLIEHEFKDTVKRYTIIDKTDLKNIKYSSIYFYRYFINEVKKLFSPLELEYENNVITIINKKELLKKLIDETYNFFIKYPNKIEEMNSILNDMKKGLEYENFEQEIDEESIYPYIFKINLFLDKEEKILKSKSPEIISEYNVPTIINYLIKGIHRNKIKIFFDEKLDEEEVSFEEIKFELKKELNISESEFFDFNFTIKGYYIYNVSTDTVEKIEVDKEIKFYNIKTLTKRILEIEGFKIEGKTYDEIKEEMYKYLNSMKNKEIIDKKKIMNFINKISFLERNKVFETVKSYVEKNKISFLKFDTGEIRTNEHVLLFFEENLEKYMKIDNENIKTNLEKNKEDYIQEIKELSEKDRKEKLKIMYREIFSAINSNGEIIFQIKEFKEKVKLLTKEEKEKLFKNIEFSIPKENCILKLKTNENRNYMYSRDIIRLFKEILEV
ncbi:hypothetical protein [Leptotrichia wadei]|uniref:hypothetical protein n=4 Tax=Leptotrichia wadei TaxID=157687 RepID=UPI0025F295D9|nr:hypothetical protein [Leptotrichia wadei]